jgi:hypothetical protein
MLYSSLNFSSFSFPGLKLSTSDSVLLVYLLPIFPQIVHPPDGDHYHSQLLWKIVRRIDSIAISYLSIYAQSSCESAVRRDPGEFMKVSVWKNRAFNYQILGVTSFAILTPLSSTSWCRLSFPLVSLKISSLFNFALTFPKFPLYGTYENDWNPDAISHKDCLLSK